MAPDEETLFSCWGKSAWKSRKKQKTEKPGPCSLGKRMSTSIRVANTPRLSPNSTEFGDIEMASGGLLLGLMIRIIDNSRSLKA